MQTRFIPFSGLPHSPDPWSNYFRAGDAWLASYHVLAANRNETDWGLFYVEPTAVALSLEMFVKAVASHEDNAFNSRRFSHRTADILTAYSARIPLFATIAGDAGLLHLISEYQKTMDVKYGESAVQIEGADREKLVDTIRTLRAEMCHRTGLR